jgi:tripartite-type tricarboxylate transporter receptor subunit TctC
LPAAAQAQKYPDKPIRVIVPFPAGDGIDIQARLIGQHLTERLGQQVLVDNRPGAGTLIGTEAAVKAPADGYTILLVTTTFSINPSLHPKVPYDPVKDFTPLIQTTAIPLIIVGGPQFSASNLKDMLALARQKPGQLSMGNSGIGTAAHIAMELLRMSAKIDYIHVPYKGIPPAMVDLVSGQLNMLSTSPAQVMGAIREGKIKAIAVTGARRMAQLPEVGTVAEGGLPGYEAYAWIGMVMPAGTPKDIVTRLNREIASILAIPDLKARFNNDGAEVVAGTPEAFGAHINTELAKWSRVIKEAGIKPQ